MSQYGSHGRGLAGQTFIQILKTYYQGVDVGSYPISLRRYPLSDRRALSQTFYTNSTQGSLVVRVPAELKKLTFRINGTAIDITMPQIQNGVATIDVSKFLIQGLNTIEHEGRNRHGGVTYNVNVN
jgi:hypothetical protein